MTDRFPPLASLGAVLPSSSSAVVPRAQVRRHRDATRFSSPAEILALMTPLPFCVVTLNANDHRFVSKWKMTSEKWHGQLRNRTFSKSFILEKYRAKYDPQSKSKKTDWKHALRMVHDRIWTKYGLISEEFQLDEAVEIQMPGEVPTFVFENLAEIISTLPETKNYAT